MSVSGSISRTRASSLESLADMRPVRESLESSDVSDPTAKNATEYYSTAPRPELPSGWHWMKLSEACTKVQDGTHFSPKEQASTGEYRYITAKNIKAWGLDLTELTYVPAHVHRDIYSRCNPEKGDVLYIKDGVTTGIATVNTLDEEFSLLSSVALLKPKRDVLDPYFLKYYLNSPAGYHAMTGQMTGTAIKRLILRKIKDSWIPIAPLPAQRRIVAEIEKQYTRLDAGIAALRNVRAKLKRYRAAVLKAACEGRLNGTQPKVHIAWTRSTIRDVTRESMIGLDRGRAYQKDDPDSGVPYIKMNNVSMDGRVSYDQLVYVSVDDEERKRFELMDGDILFNTRNSKELVGKVGLVRNPPQGAIYNNNLMRLRLIPEMLPAFLNIQMCSDGFRRQMEMVKKATTNVAAVYRKDLFPLPIVVPPLAEQKRIVAEVERRLSVVEGLEALVSGNLQRATRLRQSILQKAFSGKL